MSSRNLPLRLRQNMASRAEVSITISAVAPGVITKDLVFGTVVKGRQGVHAVKNVIDFLAKLLA